MDIVFQIGLPPRRIDIMTSITGVTFDEAWAARTDATKQTLGRPRDLLDLELLRRHHPRA